MSSSISIELRSSSPPFSKAASMGACESGSKCSFQSSKLLPPPCGKKYFLYHPYIVGGCDFKWEEGTLTSFAGSRELIS